MSAHGPERRGARTGRDEDVVEAALAQVRAGVAWPEALERAIRAARGGRTTKVGAPRLPGRRSLTAGLAPGPERTPAIVADEHERGAEPTGRDVPDRDAAAPSVPVMRKAAGDAPSLDELPGEVPGTGEPLPSRLRRELEAALGVDLDAVRIHRGAEVDRAARALDATAFAIGQGIGIRSDAYDPARPDGVRLLAHEVAHTVQARGGGGTPGISQPGDVAEAEADHFADAFVARRADDDRARPPRLELATRASASVQRQTTGVPAASTLPVTFTELASEGRSWSGQPLGSQVVLTYYLNGVELRFALHEAESQFTAIRPRQYGGPEAKWVLHGNPSDVSAFRVVHEGPGPGWDDPLPESVTRSAGRIGYRDSPGPEIGGLILAPEGPPARIYCVQNFTGWIEGVPTGGGGPLRISPTANWYSIVGLVNTSWEARDRPPRYVHTSQSQTGLGWRPTTAPTR